MLCRRWRGRIGQRTRVREAEHQRCSRRCAAFLEGRDDLIRPGAALIPGQFGAVSEIWRRCEPDLVSILRTIQAALPPEFAGNLERLDTSSLPPGPLVA